MALIVGDIHGNVNKCDVFLDYKQEQQHIFVGDFMDSFSASDEDIVSCLQMALDTDAILLSGNHDNQYYKNAGWFTSCSGYRGRSANLFVHLIEANKDRFKACHIVDNYFVCHGGIDHIFGSKFDTMEELADFCNSEFKQFQNAVIPQKTGSIIFNVNALRGGGHPFSGIFWASIGMDQLDTRFNQVVGHTHRDQPQTIVNDDTVHIGIDCPQFTCYNTETHEFEDFMPDHLRADRSKYEIKF